MKYSISILLLFISFFMSAQEITVEFIKNGKAQNIADNFKVYFVSGDSSHLVIIKPRINGNSFIVPPIQDTKAMILFEYKGKVYHIGERNVEFKQNMKWVFGFDKKPYSKDYYADSINDESVQGVFYLELHPLNGDGVVSMLTFESMTEFFEYGKSLIYN